MAGGNESAGMNAGNALQHARSRRTPRMDCCCEVVGRVAVRSGFRIHTSLVNVGTEYPRMFRSYRSRRRVGLNGMFAEHRFFSRSSHTIGTDSRALSSRTSWVFACRYRLGACLQSVRWRSSENRLMAGDHPVVVAPATGTAFFWTGSLAFEQFTKMRNRFWLVASKSVRSPLRRDEGRTR